MSASFLNPFSYCYNTNAIIPNMLSYVLQRERHCGKPENMFRERLLRNRSVEKLCFYRHTRLRPPCICSRTTGPSMKLILIVFFSIGNGWRACKISHSLWFDFIAKTTGRDSTGSYFLLYETTGLRQYETTSLREVCPMWVLVSGMCTV